MNSSRLKMDIKQQTAAKKRTTAQFLAAVVVVVAASVLHSALVGSDSGSS